MIYALLSKKCRESHLCTFMGQIAQDLWDFVLQGDFFKWSHPEKYGSGPTQQDKMAKYTGPTQETGPPQQKK